MRIVTLNTWKNEGDYARRLSVMATGLRSLCPDIVLLQESFRTLDGEARTAALLAQELGLTPACAAARTKPRLWGQRLVPSESGLAILVRGSIADIARLPLPSDERGGERIALLITASIDGCDVIAGCLHLSHVRGDDARRREQLEAILAHPWWRQPAALRVLGGDCNAAANSPALAWLAEHRDLDVRNVFGSAASSPTHPLPLRAGRAGRAIDHLFTVTSRDAAASIVRRAALALVEPIDGVYASDHAAVVADIEAVSPHFNASSNVSRGTGSSARAESTHGAEQIS